MTNMGIFLVGASVAVSVAATIVFSGGQPRSAAGTSQAAVARPADAARPVEHVSAVEAAPTPEARVESSDAVAWVIAPLPADATVVPDDDLLKLAAMVDLANARHRPPDKAQWRRALPVAQLLQQGPCDCEQRNWLNHFVAMGNDALTDAGEDYYESAKLMTTLGRSDNHAMAVSHGTN